MVVIRFIDNSSTYMIPGMWDKRSVHCLGKFVQTVEVQFENKKWM